MKYRGLSHSVRRHQLGGLEIGILINMGALEVEKQKYSKKNRKD